METKKAELTSTQLITIIVLILSFAIIVIFFFSLNLGGTIDREGCRNSVALRGTFSFFGGSLIKLKCQTENICISMGSDCKTDNKKITRVDVQGETALLREVSFLMADCWWMMGQGKVNYGDKGSCAICYNVYFDEKAQKTLKETNYSQLYNYMIRQMPNQKETYLYYLYEISTMNALKARIGSKINIDSDKIDLTKQYSVVTSVVESDLLEPPLFIEFSADNLRNKISCSKYVT